MAADQIRLKIERAKKHIRDLDVEKTSFLAADPYATTPEYFAEHNATAYFLDKWQPIPDAIALIAGDAIHNLRSALDYLIYKVIASATGTLPDRSGFPIFKSFESFDKYMRKPGREMEDLPDQGKNLIRAAKPYQGGNDTLWCLHELSNRDKHRLLITSVFAVKQFGMEVGGRALERFFPHFIRFRSGELPQKTVWLKVPDRRLGAQKGDLIFSMAGNLESHNDIQFTFDIALAEPEVFKGKPLLEVLSTATEVVESLVADFSPLLVRGNESKAGSPQEHLGITR